MRTGKSAALLIVVMTCIFFVPLVAALEDPLLEKTALELEARLIAPCCWRQPVSIHYSPASQEIKKEIRERLKAGQKPDEIVSHFVSVYGEQILASPAYTGFGGFAYFLPAVFLILGGTLVCLVIRHLRSAQEAASHKIRPEEAADPYLERLHREMWG